MAVARRTSFAHAGNAAYSCERTPVEDSNRDGNAPAVAAWRESMLTSEETFRVRLRHSGLTEESFGERIGAGPFTPAPEAIAWTEDLAAALATPSGDITDLPITTKQFATVFPRLPFEGLLGPLLAYYEGQLSDRLAAGPEPETARRIARSLRGQLLGSLANRLLLISLRTLILELNVARVDGRLHGATPEERYDWYSRELLAEPSYLEELFSEYPVLGRSMAECGSQWTAHVAEMFNRLAADVPNLRTHQLIGLSAGDPCDIRLDLGDAHNRGRSVVLLTFRDGSRVVYKPRSMATEMLYSQVVQTVNAHGSRWPNRAMRVLERDGYGWGEFIEHAPCDSSDDVTSFYRRVGGTLANLLYLGAIDFHLENIIAAGAYPVPIDLETVFQQAPYEDDAVTAHEHAMHTLFESVLATGMLPALVFGDHRRGGVDLSGIGGGVPQKASRALPAVVDEYRDTMRIEARFPEIQDAANRPYTESGDIRPEHYTEEIVAGFNETYDIITKNSDVFSGVLGRAADIEIRHLARPTRRYGLFLTEGYHPDYLRDALDRERLFDKLWAAADTRPGLIPLVELEKLQLLHGDIPCFRTRPSGTGLDAPGYAEVPEYFTRPSIAVLRRRFRRYGPDHRDVQERIVRETMSTLATGAWQVRHRPPTEDAQIHVPEAARAAANRLAAQLADRAVLGRDDCSWIGISIDGGQEDALTYKPLGTALYDGLAGMAMMFGHAATLFEDDRYLDLAQRSAVPLLEHLEDARENGLIASSGAFDGIGGLLYALDHLEWLTCDPRYAEGIAAAAPLLLRTAQEESSPDVVGGLAGCAVVAAGLYRRHGDRRFREVAEVCAHRLMETSVEGDGTAGWKPAVKSQPLGGFSHGSAGIAWALSELAALFDSADLRELSRKAVEFDRRLFVPEEGRWRDLRLEQGIVSRRPREQAGWWCNGGVGIGLSRLLLSRGEPEQELLEEARVALETTHDGGFGQNHSLCHGDLGNLELFTLAARVLPDEAEATRWRRAGERIAQAALGRIEETGVRSGVPGAAVDVPGMMIGTAGVCMGLMRLAAPERTPSVLWLEFPASPEEPAPLVG
ncbi:type 2 lanthipeptide synthetase LanM family protein [Streptomyces sporangiiformans]|uniref:Type 2 lantipeptide synthetase LanM n=1 Tax=Streptomyces sporangiiformans TaxID=2315329 RepID=A0A505DQN0_9ACTN|nr:type 2 lanthipeptide synthetase LanM family protein [Streptomyces sporangiiformans]TPQ23472.1 type 2 lantipeptide synthetase LanM [Streptomyces sporangiiformans]